MDEWDDHYSDEFARMEITGSGLMPANVRFVELIPNGGIESWDESPKAASATISPWEREAGGWQARLDHDDLSGPNSYAGAWGEYAVVELVDVAPEVCDEYSQDVQVCVWYGAEYQTWGDDAGTDTGDTGDGGADASPFLKLNRHVADIGVVARTRIGDALRRLASGFGWVGAATADLVTNATPEARSPANGCLPGTGRFQLVPRKLRPTSPKAFDVVLRGVMLSGDGRLTTDAQIDRIRVTGGDGIDLSLNGWHLSQTGTAGAVFVRRTEELIPRTTTSVAPVGGDLEFLFRGVASSLPDVQVDMSWTCPDGGAPAAPGSIGPTYMFTLDQIGCGMGYEVAQKFMVQLQRTRRRRPFLSIGLSGVQGSQELLPAKKVGGWIEFWHREHGVSIKGAIAEDHLSGAYVWIDQAQVYGYEVCRAGMYHLEDE